MFAEQQIKDYLTGMIKASGLDYPDTSAILDVAIPMGIAEFWGLYPWQDRFKVSSITTTNDEVIKLPSDFDSIITVKQTETASGWKLTRLIKEDFDARFPKLSYWGTGNPQFYSIFKDDGVWKITFAPKADSGIVIPLKYHRTAPTVLTAIPAKLSAVAVAFILKNCYPMQEVGRQQAQTQALSELSLAQNADKESSADITYFPTEGDVGGYPLTGDAPWLGGWNEV